MPNFKQDHSADTLFIEGSLDSLLPEDSPARVVWGALEDLDFSRFEARYRNDAGGCAAVHPRRLAAVWILALLKGITSSVQVAKRCSQDIEFRWLLGGVQVQKSTLCAFRKSVLDELTQLAAQVLAAMARAGQLPGKALGTDGSVVQAAAACGASKSRKQLQRRLGKLEEAVGEALDAGDEEGAEESAIKRLTQAMERTRKALKEMDELGLRDDKDRITQTEPEAKMQKMKNGAFAPAHNVQTTVDLESGAIIVTEIIDQRNDGGQLQPQLEAAEAVFDAVAALLEDPQQGPGPVKAVAADSMYQDTRQIVDLEARDVDTFVPDRQADRRPPGVSEAYKAQAFTYDEGADTMHCPEGKVLNRRKLNNAKTATVYQAQAGDCASCPHKPECCPNSQSGRSVNRPIYGELLDALAQRLESERGKAFRQARSVVVEGAYARLKERFNWRRCRTWGADGARAEALWRAIAHNLMLLAGHWRPLVPQTKLPV